MPQVSRIARSRAGIIQVLVVALLVTLSARLWYLQVHSGARFRQAAAANSERSVVTPAVRGSILDDEGLPLVTNHAGLEVAVDLSTLQRLRDRGKGVLGRLAAMLGQPAALIEQRARLCSPTVSQPCWTGSPYQPIPVARDVPVPIGVKLMEDRGRYPGVSVVPAADRVYPKPYGASAAQVLGYLSPVAPGELSAPGSAYQPSDMVGRSGLEQTYDAQLRGRAGVAQVAVDNLGRSVRTVSMVRPVAGDDLVTTLDARIQAVAEQQLADAVKGARSRGYAAESGAVVVLDVNTGGVVAMASYPSYDPDVWAHGITPDEYAKLTSKAAGIPLLDRAYQGEFPPGSTFKAVTTSAMLEDGYPAKGTYDCTPTFAVGNQVFHNFEGESYGPISLKRTIEVSCDTVFYRAAYEMWLRDGGNRPVPRPLDPVQTMARDYGLGRATGIDLPGEAPGDIETRREKLATWKRMKDIWCLRAQSGYPSVEAKDPKRGAYLKQIAHENCLDGWQFRGGDAVIEAIGQGGILVTPLQLARVYAAVANGGVLYQPHLEKALISPDGKVVSRYQPKVTGHVPISPATRAFLVDAFEGVAREGTASGDYGSWPLDQIKVGAKTGTADVYGKQATSVFASFLPADHPQYAVAMMVSQAGQGAMTSGPAVEKIEEALYGVQNGAVVPGAPALPQPPARLPVVDADGTLPNPSVPTTLPSPSPTLPSPSSTLPGPSSTLPGPSSTLPGPSAPPALPAAPTPSVTPLAAPGRHQPGRRAAPVSQRQPAPHGAEPVVFRSELRRRNGSPASILIPVMRGVPGDAARRSRPDPPPGRISRHRPAAGALK